MSIYYYTFDFDTLKNDTFKSVIFRYSQKWLLGPFWHFGENFEFDTFKNDTFESVYVDRHPPSVHYIKSEQQSSISSCSN